ncbi:hypothetical protein [Paracoccus shanxieyensis]|uniref:Uncharacterized protein n=1 Tax=Paracoccus shanxieyensis TaxID=2675752 RepID=A0A6L6J7E9_9RHOB|nr:hypothetical protein [Paracoccus shanxieyensis]MTH66727.1 hypothetical protein [Paracoccus shanxieyensis]MTH89962.1 hypothetical protein [Paracoccus shanxieyensis]
MEIIVAIVVAFHAMIGGALLNAAFTAPRNCIVVVYEHWTEAQVYFWMALAALCVGFVLTVSLGNSWDGVFMILMLGAGNIFWFVMLVLSRNVAESILMSENSQGSDAADEKAVNIRPD